MEPITHTMLKIAERLQIETSSTTSKLDESIQRGFKGVDVANPCNVGLRRDEIDERGHCCLSIEHSFIHVDVKHDRSILHLCLGYSESILSVETSRCHNVVKRNLQFIKTFFYFQGNKSTRFTSNLLSLTILQKTRDPATLHRSPMLMKFVNGPTRNGSKPFNQISLPSVKI